MLRYSLPLGIAGIVTVATGAADPIVVGGFLSQSQLGAYYAAIAISAGLGVMLFTPLNTAFFPETSSYADDPGTLSTGLRLAFSVHRPRADPSVLRAGGLSQADDPPLLGRSLDLSSRELSFLQMMSAFFLFVAMQGISPRSCSRPGRRRR